MKRSPLQTECPPWRRLPALRPHPVAAQLGERLPVTSQISIMLGKRDKRDATRWPGWNRSINISLVTCSGRPIQDPKSKMCCHSPRSTLHAPRATRPPESYQFRTTKLPVLEHKVASSGPESCQFRTRKLPVFHSFARLSTTCMTTGGKNVHLSRPLVLPNLVSSRHNVREWKLVHRSSFIIHRSWPDGPILKPLAFWPAGGVNIGSGDSDG